MKKYAFFLPQFHEIKENNEWWGQGFTEWVNVKKAKSLFQGHKQPKVPIDGYYNLLDKNVVINQTKLLEKYNLDGLIYYHYWFKGKKLLEKPAENLLNWKDINQNFFFCWANHSWIKSWEGKKTILQKQEYGDVNDWEEHFQYLLQFFKDKRYVKENNKPLLVIFNSNFEEKESIFEYFDKRCRDYSFNGIYIINTYGNYKDCINHLNDQTSYSFYNFLREPTCSTDLYRNLGIKVYENLRKKLNLNKVRIYNGDKLLNLSINKIKKDPKIIHGLFFEWDNTPRHNHRGYVITPISKLNFEKYMNIISDEKYVFINAWNEWAEGMTLEGTMENGYKYLEWINEWSLSNDKKNKKNL